MLASIGPTSRAPVVAGLSVSGSSAQPTVMLPPLTAGALAADPPAPGEVPPPELQAAASKHAVVTLSETLHHELRLANARIGVSVLCPAYVPTGISRSERNRPAELAEDAPPTSSQIAARQRSDKAVASGKLGAPDVARITFEAIREGRFYVITHPKLLPTVELRLRDVLEQRTPSDPYTYRPDLKREI